MLKPIVTYYGTTNFIENLKDLVLGRDLLKGNWLLDYLGYLSPDDEYPYEFSSLFVSI